jgi:hypothetical protein
LQKELIHQKWIRCETFESESKCSFICWFLKWSIQKIREFLEFIELIWKLRFTKTIVEFEYKSEWKNNWSEWLRLILRKNDFLTINNDEWFETQIIKC